MTAREFERRLQHCNPRLRIKKYGSSKVGIHDGTRFVCRLMAGEITPYNQFAYKKGKHEQFKTDLNPVGYYKLRLLVGRGRLETARILYTSRLIKFADVAYLSS